MRLFFAGLFSCAFVALLLLTTLALSLRSFIFDAAFYVGALKAQGVFQRLEQDPLDVLDLTDQIPLLASIPQALQQQVVTTILPPGWLEKQATQIAQDALAWLASGEDSAPEIAVDLRQLKDRLQGPPGRQVVEDVVSVIPACRSDQQPQFTWVELPECLPEVFDRIYIVDQVAASLADAAGRLPSQFDLGPRLAPYLRAGLKFNGQRLGTALLDASLLLLFLGTSLVWIIAAFIGGRNGRGRWRWLGGSLLAGSTVTIGSSLLLYLFGTALLPAPLFAALSGDLAAIGRGVANSALQQVAVRALIFSGVLFVAGWALLWIGMTRRKNPAFYRSAR
jgi:hypothetical protein